MTDDDDPPKSAPSEVESWLRDVARAPRRAVPGKNAQRTTVSLAVGELPTLDAASSPTLPALGEVLDGRYRLDAVLGEGGMGVVYAATQLATGKRVAIKWMRARAGGKAENARAAERFVREAQAAARIAHPNVVDVYDVAGDPEAPYLVMERLEGESLRARIARAPLGWDELMTLVDPVLHALEAAHRAGVIHRDLKPDNLFLAQQADGSVRLKVLDFGVSRLSSLAEDEASLTRSGAMLGTPLYMPLEQLRGASDLDGRTDVFAMGVVLYEALCGVRPYAARHAAEYGALLVSTPCVPLSQHRRELRGAREAVIARALAVQREDRFPNMAAFRSALAAVGGEMPARRRAWLGWLLLLALVSLALLWYALRREPPPSIPTPRAPGERAGVLPAPEPVAAPRAVEQPAPEPVDAPASKPTRRAARPSKPPEQAATPASAPVSEPTFAPPPADDQMRPEQF